MSPSDGSHEPRDPAWRYGIYTFPIGPFSLVASYTGLSLFVLAADSESLGMGLASFAVVFLGGWLSYLFAAIAAVALLMDALTLRDHPAWTPNPWFAGGLALVHFAGAVLAVPYLLSVPAIGYYVYRRRQHIGSGDGGSGPGPVEPSGDRPLLES
ncbi:hypothetical protein [Natrinema salinisoli]|uniref:hypothetical protein n=1 Tax=Natrinema salinisoli TaxID=2878535 RepID=UPI001CF023C7|nr:hypothetical protein [Natrinema salinisoli]